MDLMIGEWHHLAGVRSNNILMLYLNGNLVAKTKENELLPENLAVNAANQGFFMGSSAVQTLFSKAEFDDIRIYTRALPESEIISLAVIENRELPIRGPLPMDEGIGIYALDSADATGQSIAEIQGGVSWISGRASQLGTFLRWAEWPDP